MKEGSCDCCIAERVEQVGRCGAAPRGRYTDELHGLSLVQGGMGGGGGTGVRLRAGVQEERARACMRAAVKLSYVK